MSRTTSATNSSRRPSQIPSQSSDQSAPNCNTAVTRLLVSTKALLEGLSQWSNGMKSDEAISDIYVKLGNDFNDCTRAFSKAGITFSDLMSVPQDLRECLETCLSAEVASPATLEAHLPAIREIIAVMLQGLKVKQAQLKQRAQPAQQSSQSSPPNGVLSSARSSPQIGSSRLTQSQTMSASSSTTLPSEDRQTSGYPKNDQSSSVSRARTTPSSSRQPIERSAYATHSREASLPVSTTARPPLPQQPPSIPKSQSASAIASRPGTPSNLSQYQQQPPNARTSSGSESIPALPVLSFEPAPLSDVVQRESSGKGKSPERQTGSSGMASSPSFDALRSSENLARRASKRFSKYTMQTMAGSSPVQASSSSSGSPSRVNLGDSSSPSGGRKLHKTPPAHLMPIPPPPLPTQEASLAAASQASRSNSASSDSWSSHVKTLNARENLKDMNERARRPSDSWNMHVSELDGAPASSTLSRLTEEDDSEDATPKLPSSNSNFSQATGNLAQSTSSADSSASVVVNNTPASTAADPPSDPTNGTTEEEEQPSSISCFLVLGKETKKAIVEFDQGPLTIAALRVIFMDRFSYSPGQDDFPAIYIRDPRLGVEYELEDMSEVRQDCVLSLNIQPLDQVKQHIDSVFANLAKDMRDLKGSIATARRASIPPVPNSSLRSERNDSVTVSPKSQFPTDMAPAKTPTTAASSHFPMSPSNDKLVSDYKDDLQKVRRELAVTKQVFSDYTAQHKSIISALRSQTEKVKEVAATKVSASRAFIEAGKSKLDARSENLLTRVETLADLVESVRDDIAIRRIRPLPSRVETMRKEIEATRTELDAIRSHVTTITPSWKRTWSHELQMIVEEERFLKHQDKMLSELDEDHKGIIDLFGKIDELLQQPGSLRGTSGRPSRDYVPPEPDESHTGLPTVMAEVQSLSVDPDKRLRAIEQAEKQRSQEKLARKGNDPFASELGGFVDGKLLKRTGGAEETERIRRLKSEAQLKQMFDQGRATALPDSPKGSVTGSTAGQDSRPNSVSS